VEDAFSKIQAVGRARTSPYNSQSYGGPKCQSYFDLKVRFTATLGEEAEVEVALV